VKLAVFDAGGQASQIIAGPELHLVANLWMLPTDQQTRVLDGTPFEGVVSLVALRETEAGIEHYPAIPSLAEFDAIVAGGLQ
jgi:hypothetical protein